MPISGTLIGILKQFNISNPVEKVIIIETINAPILSIHNFPFYQVIFKVSHTLSANIAKTNKVNKSIVIAHLRYFII